MYDSTSSQVQVKIVYGQLEGFIYKTKHGFDCKVFLGVPYALPPVGELRFEKPEKLIKWSGVLMAKEFKPRCYPHCEEIIEPDLPYSEDCLYLNIMAPAQKSTNELGYPVIVFLHGGGFVSGGCHYYGYKDICNNFVSRGIIFVTVAYRVGFLGFFTTGDKNMLGNYGLWDQREALLYVRDNISAFGGNPDDVTVMGQSAGAASAAALTLSPHCKGLFKKAICLSGSIYCEWAISSRVCQNSAEIMRKLSWKNEGIKQKLKSISIKEIMTAGTAKYATDSMMFHPWIDGDFFPHSLICLADKIDNISMVFGLHQAESAIGVLSDATIHMWNMYVPSAKWATFSLDDFVEVVRNLIITDEKFPGNAAAAQGMVVNFYTKHNESDNLTSYFYLNRFVQLVSDVQFNIPVYIDMQLRRAKKVKTYFFVTDYFRPEIRIRFPVKGSYHSDEYKYLFGFSPAGEFDFNDSDRIFQALYLDSITNFVKHGSPSTTFGEWLPIDDQFPTRYFNFCPDKAAMNDSYMTKRICFWTKDFPEKFGSEQLSRTLFPGLNGLEAYKHSNDALSV